MNERVLLERPLLPLVRSFVSSGGSTGQRRVARLCLSAARRVLAYWEFYCDGTGPADTIVAAERWLRSGVAPDADLEAPAVPSYRGVAINDCRWGDTSAAAEAAALLVAYIRSGDELDAMESLSAADAAMDESPLGTKDEFRRWFATVAIPAAYEDRTMTEEETNRFRTFDPAATQLAGPR